MPPVRRRGAAVRNSTSALRAFPWPSILPILVLVVLNLNVFGLGYFWDDFYFLTFHPKFNLHSLVLPDPHFFRPIPLGVYFKFLGLVDPVNGVLAHGLALALLAIAVFLLVRLVTLLSTPRAGLFAGLIFAGYAHVCALTSWISTCTDLLAILFLSAAFLLRHRGQNVAALVGATAALLSKETAIAAFPVLVLWDWLLGRPTKNARLQVSGYALVAVGWALVHPGVRGLFEHGFHGGSAGYVGVQQSDLWAPHLARYLMVLLNLPPPGLASSWLEGRVVQALVALAIIVVGLLLVDRYGRSAPATPIKRIALLSALIWLPAVVMPALLVHHWAPYLACIPALGASIILGTLLATQPRWLAIGALGLFLILGARSRGIRGEREAVLSEPAMLEASQATQAVRSNFRAVFPSLPKGAQVVASVGTSGLRGIQGALFEGQALRVWYRDPTLHTVRIMKRSSNASSELLVRVTDDLNVIAIDPVTGDVRSSAPQSPDVSEVDEPLASYARAVAAAGEPDRAIVAMTNLSRMESGDFLARNNRIIASMLLASGRAREADSILAVTPALDADTSREIVLSFMTNPTANEKLDLSAFEAFGLSASDPGIIRWIMQRSRDLGFQAKAAWFAERLQRLVPGDTEAASVLRVTQEMGIQPAR